MFKGYKARGEFLGLKGTNTAFFDAFYPLKSKLLSHAYRSTTLQLK